ncbi:LOW QUALITY PROTEIN: uncharacterized protein WCC33_015103 [Rhinophrynus dorsalis]
MGKPLFDPEGIKHPRSSEWAPTPHISQYLENWIRKSMNRTTRNKLRAECPRPIVANRVCETPELDTRIVQFISKSGKDPRKGLDRALKSCQDKLLDSLGPHKIFELAETAMQSKTPINTDLLRGWIQRAICLLGNANSAIASERRRAILLRIDPKLAEMANSEPGPSANGQLFGDSFIKELGKFVSTFTALDKAQSSLKKVFNPRVFHKAGRSRGRSLGRTQFAQQRFQAPPQNTFRGQFPHDTGIQTPFFPSRGRVWRSRSGRRTFRSRPYSGKINSTNPFFTGKSGGQTLPFFPTLVQSNIRPVGTSDSKGISHRILHSPSPKDYSSSFPIRKSRRSVSRCRNQRTEEKRGHQTGVRFHPRLCEQYFPSTEKRLRPSTSDQSKITEHTCSIPSLQNGRNPSLEGFNPSVRLDDQDRLTGRVPHDTYVSSFSKLPSFPLAWSDMAIHLPSFWFVLSTLVLHETPKACNSILEESRNPTHNLSRRHPNHVTGSLSSTQSCRLHNPSFDESRFSDQLEEIPVNTIPDHGISGFRSELSRDFIESPGNKNSSYSQRNTLHSSKRTDLLEDPCQGSRSVIGLHSSNISGSTPLPGTSKIESTPFTKRPRLLRFYRSLVRRKRRAHLVAKTSRCLEWQSHFWYGARYRHRVGRQPFGLGCSFKRSFYRRKMVTAGSELTHQLSGVAGGVFRTEELSKRPCQLLCSFKDGQRLGGTIHQSPGRHEIQTIGGIGQRFLAFLPGSQCDRSCTTPTWILQCSSGLEFQIPLRSQRLDAPQTGIFPNTSLMGALSDRSLRIPTKSTSSPFLQLEAGPRSSSHGCLPTIVGSRNELRLSTICNDTTDPSINSPSTSNGSSNYSFLANATMVSSSSGIVRRRSTPTPFFSQSLNESIRRSSRFVGVRESSTHGLVRIGSTFDSGGISESARSLLAESWAPGTRTMYQSAWSSWSSWCLERDLDPISAPSIEVVNFLSHLFDLGKAYRTINTYRSAISAGHTTVDGIPVGQTVIVCRLMRGIRFSRPPQSRYLSIWNVNDVLRFLENWPANESLSLKQLSAKLTMLLCLVSFKRVSDVRALDLHSRSFTPSGVQFQISRLTKTTIRTISYPSFPSQPQLCVVKCLQEYEKRTAPHRNPKWSQLLISFRTPFLPVSAATLARWVRWIMQLAGINIALFGAHSSRGAMASMALQSGGRLEDILRAADWSRESTFKEFYCKPIDHVSTNVLNNL